MGTGGAPSGRERYYALMFDKIDGGRVQADQSATTKIPFWPLRGFHGIRPEYEVELQVNGNQIDAYVAERSMFAVLDTEGSRCPRRRGPCCRHRVYFRAVGPHRVL